MLAIILSIILAVIISFLVTMDAGSVNLYFGTTTLSGIPLFFVVFISIIIGLLLASVTTIKNLIESKLTIFGKNSDLKKSYKISDRLQEKINKLEEEKSNLKERLKDVQPNRKFPFSFKIGQKNQK